MKMKHESRLECHLLNNSSMNSTVSVTNYSKRTLMKHVSTSLVSTKQCARSVGNTRNKCYDAPPNTNLMHYSNT